MHDAKLSDVEDSQSKQDNNIQSQPHPIHGISQTNRRNLRHVTHDPGRERESPTRSLGANEGLDGGEQPECVRGADDEDGKQGEIPRYEQSVGLRKGLDRVSLYRRHYTFLLRRLGCLSLVILVFWKKCGVTSSWPRPTALIIFVRTEASWRISTDFSFPQQRAQLALWPNTRELESIDCEACKLDNEVNSQILCKVAFLCCKFL